MPGKKKQSSISVDDPSKAIFFGGAYDTEQSGEPQQGDESRQIDREEVHSHQQHHDHDHHHSKKSVLLNALALILFVLAVIVVITCAVLLPERNSATDAPEWIAMPYEGLPFSKTDMKGDQVQLAGINGSRFFVSKTNDSLDTVVSQIYNYNTTNGWTEQIKFEARERTGFITNFAASMDGSRLAIANYTSITVYEEASSSDSWRQVGESLTPSNFDSFPGLSFNVSSINHFGWDAMALSKDGRLLSFWADLAAHPENTPIPHQKGFIAVFREIGGRWWPVDQYRELLEFETDPFNFYPVISESGDVLTLTLAGEEGTTYEHLEVVSLYEYSMETKWKPLETLFVEPEGNEDNSVVSSFGYQGSVALSYNGSVVAIGAKNYKIHDRSYGLVKAFVNAGIGKYQQRGQTLEAGSEMFLFGEFVSLSSDGNRLAVYYSQDGRAYIQVYDLRNEKWVTLGLPIVEDVRDTAEDLSLSPDGSRIAVTWDCTPREYSCASVYELSLG